jgi:hypothetical protein
LRPPGGVSVVAARQAETSHIAEVFKHLGVALAPHVAAGDDPALLAVVNLQLAAQHVGDPTAALLKAVVKMIVLAVAEPVLNQPQLSTLNFPVLLADQYCCKNLSTKA